MAAVTGKGQLKLLLFEEHLQQSLDGKGCLDTGTTLVVPSPMFYFAVEEFQSSKGALKDNFDLVGGGAAEVAGGVPVLAEDRGLPFHVY